MLKPTVQGFRMWHIHAAMHGIYEMYNVILNVVADLPTVMALHYIFSLVREDVLSNYCTSLLLHARRMTSY